MKQHTRSLPVLVLVAVVALVLGSIGTAVAGPAITKKKVKSIATKVVNQKAASLSVANAANAGNATTLNGQPSTNYLNQVYTVAVTPASGVASFEKAMPAIPNGNYLASVNINVSSATGPFFCALSIGGSFIASANGSVFSSLQTVSLTKLITVTGPVSLYCQSSANMTAPFPGNLYGTNTVTFQRVDTLTNAGSTSPGAGTQGSPRPDGAPGR